VARDYPIIARRVTRDNYPRCRANACSGETFPLGPLSIAMASGSSLK
jgi:hypothetical protein